jgi:hypothetical protein
VTYLEAFAYCESNTQSATIQHVATLGVFCSDLPPDDPYNFTDLYFECAESAAQFDVLIDDGIFNTTSNRYACAASKIFATGSTSSNSQTISRFAITTDITWLSVMNEACYTRYVSAAPVPMTNAPVTPSPTVVINTTSQSLFPTIPPMDAPIRPSTNPPAVASPAAFLPQETTPTISVQSPESKNDSGKLIGGFVGGVAAGIVILSLVGYFIVRRPADSSNRPKPEVNGSVVPLPLEEGTTGYDNVLEPATTPELVMHSPCPNPLPPAPMVVATHPPVLAQVVPSTNDHVVDYKDQARTVIDEVPVVAIAEMVPFADAILDRSAALDG